MKMQHKRIFSLLTVSSVALFAAGCNVLENPGMINAGGSAIKAMSLSKDEVVQISNQSCAEMDAQSTVASASSAYGRRLAKIVAPLPKEVNGQQINYKVYQVKEVNAWAMDNGCVRVYAGLLDLMNDDEVRGVIGHELGHVALGHSAASMRTAYATSAVRQAAAASGNSAVQDDYQLKQQIHKY